MSIWPRLLLSAHSNIFRNQYLIKTALIFRLQPILRFWVPLLESTTFLFISKILLTWYWWVAAVFFLYFSPSSADLSWFQKIIHKERIRKAVERERKHNRFVVRSYQCIIEHKSLMEFNSKTAVFLNDNSQIFRIFLKSK